MASAFCLSGSTGPDASHGPLKHGSARRRCSLPAARRGGRRTKERPAATASGPQDAWPPQPETRHHPHREPHGAGTRSCSPGPFNRPARRAQIIISSLVRNPNLLRAMAMVFRAVTSLMFLSSPIS